MHQSQLVCFCVLVVIAVSASAQFTPSSIGDRLIRDYTQYFNLPVTIQDATAAGWKNSNSTCDPNLGLAYTLDASGATKEHPLVLYFTTKGQIAGAGVHVYGSLKQNLITLGFWRTVGHDEYSISVTFRDSSAICTGQESDLPLGDRLVINQDGIAFPIPVIEKELVLSNWTRGSCFAGMGHHWFYDVSSHGNMTWEAGNLLPIVPMYNAGKINAFFFASSSVQQGLLDTHMWEKIPLPNLLMCKNWCDASCTFHDTSFWSTLHLYLTDYTQVTCAGGCTTACCP